MSNKVQRSFAGGEQAPSLWARTDQIKYATGLRTCRNFIVQRHGGVANRSGTLYVGATKYSDRPVHLVGFVFNAEQTYVLEFGDRYLRVIRQGGFVLDGSAVYELATPYLADDLAELQHVQSADTITLVHPKYPPHDLQRTGHAAWSLTPITFGPSIGGVTSLSASGGTTGGDRWWAVTAIDGETLEEGLPVTLKATDKVPASGTPTQLAWLGAAGAIKYNIYRSSDGLTFGHIGTSGGLPLKRSDNTWSTTTSDVTTNTVRTWKAATNKAQNPVVSSGADRAADRLYTVVGTIQVSGLNLGAGGYVLGQARIYYSRGAEPRVDTGVIRYVYADADPMTGDASSGSKPFTATIEVPDNGYSALTIEIVAEVYFDGTAPGPQTADCTVDGTRIDWTSGSVGFADEGQAPEYSIAPPTQRGVFAMDGRYPSAVGYYLQRRLFANTTLEPEKVWGSRIGSYASFPTSTPMQDDDSVVFSLASREVNAVRHLVDLDALFLFTSGGIMKVEGDQDGSLTPTAINPRRKAPYGAALLPPIEIGSGALFVEARQSLVRDFRPDAPEDQRSRDLTIFAAHLFDRFTVVDWAFAKNPHSVIWAVRSDGVLLGLTYLPEHEVWGWHRHDTDGQVERVCVVPEGSEDAVYLVVRRTVNGATVRYVERMASRQLGDISDAVFVDAALSYDGWNASETTMTLSGGVAWNESEVLTITASADTFTAGDVGNAVHFTDESGRVLRVRIEAYTSATVVQGRPDRTVPVELQGVATATWARAVDELSGLEHLEGKRVAILADGFVVASPNNSTYPVLTVASGKVTLDQPYAKIHVGLPYISDLETLDIDNAQGPSVKSQKMLVNKVGLFVESSRGIFVGGKVPDGDDPLAGLDEPKSREDEDYDEPPALHTDYLEVTIANEWSRHGRICVRQVDPLPLTILSVTPQGFIPQTN